MSIHIFHRLVTFVEKQIILIAFILVASHATADNVVFYDNFSSFYKDDNPWTGVDSSGLIKVIPGKQLVVSDTGEINEADLSPSVAVGDLNGDGLLDLVVADAMGYFWYFQNHGSKSGPVFTTGEIMPLWFGDPCPDLFNQAGLVTKNIIPRIQLIDLNGQGKLDLIVGNYLGKLFYVQNSGSKSSPRFKLPPDINEITVPTRKNGLPWCNYLAPFFYDWRQRGTMDLAIGDGSYSANSIYLIKNSGSNDRPSLGELGIDKIIPGMGREQLVPQVVSWNGDGKADILSAEREGYVNIFLNQSNDQQDGPPVFDHGHHVLIGGQERIGPRPTVTMADLMGTGLPGLVIGTTDSHISFSKNIGKPNDYKFDAPKAFSLANQKPGKILVPYGWTLDGAYGSPYELLVCTNSQVEPDFVPPDDSDVTTALRFYIDEPAQPSLNFPDHFYPAFDTRSINRREQFALKAGTRYTLSFWIKSEGDIGNLKYIITGLQPNPNESGQPLGRTTMSESVQTTNLWNHYSTTIRFRSLSDDKHLTCNFDFHMTFNGKGSLYLAGLKVEEAP